MKKALEKLPATQLKRIHRSNIASADKVKSILNKKAALQSSTELAVSDSYLDFISQWKKLAGYYNWPNGSVRWTLRQRFN